MNEQGLERLHELWRRGTEFLGSDYAILGGAMTWVSERNLVSAISNAGGFGVVACGGMTPDLLAAEIDATRALTDKPFGVNLITLHPGLMDLIEVCREKQVSHVVLAGGLPSGDAIAAVKAFGAKLMCFAPTAALAKKLVRTGADAIVIEGMEAGGHIGPVSTSVLAQEILPVIRDVPVFVAGGIGRGDAIAAYLEMGASGAQLGTRFVVAEECVAHEKFKKAFIRASARDAVASVQIDPRFPVIPVRALKNEGTEQFMETQRDVVARFHAGELNQEDGQMQIEHFWGGALRRAVVDGDVESGSVMAGQSVGMVKKVEPTAYIIQELVEQAAHHVAEACGFDAN
ncbi:NAD(P)H-dependent flavin oxidoreductase [Kordiimonas marina]|uniref:NAD(P)H-dependent flavin oxidoreductase n=1 Tax=Kordiimonas marina TaxID=2872312 RepID=UPI001FF26AA7|nr:nitronate monooxygenase family protein [Kordiimonas marina]MCJ9430452.1 nitronate monooxygenase family protein [Kordiimonas marina]